MVGFPSGASWTLVCILLVTSMLAGVPTATAQADDVANVTFEADIPAPVHSVAASGDGRHVAVLDDDARITFLGDAGATEESWTAPHTGTLAMLDPTLGEVAPQPRGLAFEPRGDHWAAAIAYEGEHPGKVFGFARWSDAPVWTFTLPGGSTDGNADQPTLIVPGGPYYGVATAEGNVHLVKAAPQGGSTQHAHRTYDQDNLGEPFERVDGLAVSDDGKTVLIGTASSGERPTLHVFTDTFFRATFKRITDPVHTVATSGDGAYGAAVTGQGPNTRLMFLDLENGTVLWETGTGSSITALELDHDGDVLVAGMEGGRVALFRYTGGMTDRTATQSHELGSKVTDVAIDTTGRAIAASTEAGATHFLTLGSGQTLWTHDAGRPLAGLALSTDGEVLVLGARGDDGRVIYTQARHDIAHVTAPRPTARPGEDNPIQVDLANNGNRVENITTRWAGLPEGWTSQTTRMDLLPGRTGQLDAIVTPPSGHPAGQYGVTLHLDHDHGSIPIPITLNVPEITSGRASVAWGLDAAVPGGAPAAFLFLLENTGNTPHRVQIGYAEVPAGWKAEFTTPVDFRMQPGTTRDVVLKVYAPSDAPRDREAWFDVIVAWQEGEQRIPITLHLLDAQTYRDRVLREDADPDGPAGATTVRDQLIDELGTLDPEVPPLELDGDKGKVEEKDSPGAGLALAVVGLVGLVAWKRRRT